MQNTIFGSLSMIVVGVLRDSQFAKDLNFDQQSTTVKTRTLSMLQKFKHDDYMCKLQSSKSSRNME